MSSSTEAIDGVRVRMVAEVRLQDAGRVRDLLTGTVVNVSPVVAASLIAKGFAVADVEG